MGRELREFKNNIATSLYLAPCNIDELMTRVFLLNNSRYGVEMMIQALEKEGALYYKGRNELMHIKKAWAKKNLRDRELDFRTEREKWIDGLSDFQKSFYGINK